MEAAHSRCASRPQDIITPRRLSVGFFCRRQSPPLPYFSFRKVDATPKVPLFMFVKVKRTPLLVMFLTHLHSTYGGLRSAEVDQMSYKSRPFRRTDVVFMRRDSLSHMPSCLHSAVSISVTSLLYRQIVMHFSNTQLNAASCVVWERSESVLAPF